MTRKTIDPLVARLTEHYDTFVMIGITPAGVVETRTQLLTQRDELAMVTAIEAVASLLDDRVAEFADKLLGVEEDDPDPLNEDT